VTTKATGTPPHEEAREGVYLARLTIENARCFRTRQTLDLTARDGTIAHWTLLIGENGTGKTTLLQSIAALAPTAGMGPAPAPEREAAWHEWRQRRLRWQEVCSAPEQEADRYTELELRPGIAPLQAEAGRSLVRWVDARGFGNGTVATLGLRGESPVFFAYGPHRRASREAFTAGATSDALTALTSDLPLVNVEDWYLRRDYIATNSHNTPAERAAATRSRDRVASLVCRVLPGVEGLVPVTVDAARGETTLMAETDAGRVRVAELGFGMQSTLAWVVDLAVRMMTAYPDSDDPLARARGLPRRRDRPPPPSPLAAGAPPAAL
jgi:energy-coupling factor transporter ATP-binding protein EcfA2